MFFFLHLQYPILDQNIRKQRTLLSGIIVKVTTLTILTVQRTGQAIHGRMFHMVFKIVVNQNMIIFRGTGICEMFQEGVPTNIVSISFVYPCKVLTLSIGLFSEMMKPCSFKI